MVSNMWTARTRSHQTPPICKKPDPPPLRPAATITIYAWWEPDPPDLHLLRGTILAFWAARPIGETVTAWIDVEYPYNQHIDIPTPNGLSILWAGDHADPTVPAMLHGYAVWDYWTQAHTSIVLQPP